MKKLLNQEEEYDQIDGNPDQMKIEDLLDEGYSNSNQIIQSQQNEIKKTNKWTQKEDEALKKLVQTFGEKNWRKISGMMEGRSAIQCLHRWSKILKPGLVKGPWTSEEDEKLVYWVQQYGPYKWSQCSELITGRSGKQCRERWFNNLNPNVKKGNWTQEEDNCIFQGYLSYGSSWSRIAKNLEGRTENSVKNRFYSTVRKLLSDMEKKGKFVNQDNECDIKNIIQQSLQDYTNSAAALKAIEEEQEQQDQQRKSSTTITNSVSAIQDCSDSNMKTPKQTLIQEMKEENSEIHKFDKLGTEENKKQNEDIRQNNDQDQLKIKKKESEQDCEAIEQGQSQQNIIQPDIERNRNVSGQSENNKELIEDTNDHGEEEEESQQYSRQQITEENQQQQTSNPPQTNTTQNNLINQSLQQNLLLPILQSQQHQQQQPQSQIKLKDEYSQQNCLYRLILEGNVSIKKTTSMRDYSLYQKNKAKSRSKKYQREQSEELKKSNSQFDEASPCSQMSNDQFIFSQNLQGQVNQQGTQLKGINASEPSKEQKLMMHISQLQKLEDSSMQQLTDQAQQKLINLQNNKNSKSSIKGMIQTAGKGNMVTQNNKNNTNNNNLSTLLKEKLMSMTQFKKNKNDQKKKSDIDDQDDEENSSQEISDQQILDKQLKKNIKHQQLPTILEKAQKLQKEIEEKKQQLLMLSLEGRPDKRKVKNNYLDNIEESKQNGKKMSYENQKRQLISLKEEFQEDTFNQNNEKYESKNKKQNGGKVTIDQEQQKKIFQRMVQGQNLNQIRKQMNQNSDSNSQCEEEEDEESMQVEHANSNLQQQLKLLSRLQLYNKLKRNHDSNMSDEDKENQLDSDEDSQMDEEEEDNEEEEEDEESSNISNKLMKYLSSSFAKMMHSITQKYNQKLQVGKQSKRYIKNMIKQQAHKQQLLEQIQQSQQSSQKTQNSNRHSHNLNSSQISQNNNNNNNNLNKKKHKPTLNPDENRFSFDQELNKKVKKEENSESLSQVDENMNNNQNQIKDKQKTQIIKNRSKDDQLLQKGSQNSQNLKQNKLTGRNKSQSMFQNTIEEVNPQAQNQLPQDQQGLNISQQLFPEKSASGQTRKKSKSQTTNKNSIINISQQEGKEGQCNDSTKGKLSSKNINKIEIENLGKNCEKLSRQSKQQQKSDQQTNKKPEQNSTSFNNQQYDHNQSKQNLIDNQSHDQQNENAFLPEGFELTVQSSMQNSHLDLPLSLNLRKSSSQYQNNSIDFNNLPHLQALSNKNQNGSAGNQTLLMNSINDQQPYERAEQSNIKMEIESQPSSIANNINNNPNNANIFSQSNSVKPPIPFSSIINQIPQDASKGDDRIDYLINQLQSLETLLNTTKQELNKLESTINVPDQLSPTNQSPTLLQQDTINNNLGIISGFSNKISTQGTNFNQLNHSMSYGNINSYRPLNSHHLHHTIQPSYLHNNSLSSSMMLLPQRKSSHHSDMSQINKYNSNHINSINQTSNNNLLQNSFEGSSDSNNLNHNMGGGKLHHHHHHHHISDITSMEFGFDHKYSNDDMQSIVGQDQEKDIYHLANLSPSPSKDDGYQQKDNNELLDSSQNIQDKNISDLINLNAESETSNNSQINKRNIIQKQPTNTTTKEINILSEEEKGKENQDQTQTPSQQKDKKKQQTDIQSEDMLRIDNSSYLNATSSSNLNYGKAKQFKNVQDQTYVKQFVISNGDSGSYLNDENHSIERSNICDD